MDNTKSFYDNEGKEQAELMLRLDYMVEDFMELIQKKESKELAGEDS